MIFFSRTVWDIVDMSISMPTDQLFDMQQLTLSLSQMQTATVPQVKSFLGKVIFICQ